MEKMFLIAYRNSQRRVVCEYHNSHQNEDDFLWFSRSVIRNKSRDVFRIQGKEYDVWLIWDTAFSGNTIDKKQAIEIASRMIDSLEEKPDTLVSLSEYYQRNLL